MADEMVSFGAGVNSVAMTIMLVNEGWRGPIVFADTGGEIPETYCYMDYFQHQFLKPHRLEITRLSPITHPEFYNKRECEYGTLEAFCLGRALLPMLFTRWCTREWKVVPVERWQRENKKPNKLLGICASEPRRIRDDPFVFYPLYDLDVTRKECRRIIQRMGLDYPPKSSCFFCPGRSLGEYKRLYYDHPDLWERARQLELTVSRVRKKRATIKFDYSLDEMAASRWQGQTEMDLSRWLPCLCKL